ncbi:hypothetical protein ACV54S_005161, partial [Escherichia coli]
PRQKQKKLIMLPSETMIWQPEFTDKTLSRKPGAVQWANDIRLMRERDGRNHRDMCVLFRWACQDNFWSGNVLSPAKLRDKWTQLEINRNKQQAVVTASKPKLDLTNTDWIYGVDL